MKPIPVLLLSLAAAAVAAAQSPVIPSPEVQIKAALQAAAPAWREGAKVYVYAATGALVVLRPGTNNMVCLADDPRMPGFSAACYHKDLDPFTATGHEGIEV